MDFKKIDTSKLDWSRAVMAQKTARVQAEMVDAGYELVTVTSGGHVETKNVAPAGGAVKVTNPGGEQYLISMEKFGQRYAPTGDGDFAPTADPVRVLPVTENVSFTAPWGEEMNIKAGGVYVYGGPGDIYGIQPEEFAETYSYRPDLDKAPETSIESDAPTL